jgi:hypothetical protein
LTPVLSAGRAPAFVLSQTKIVRNLLRPRKVTCTRHDGEEVISFRPLIKAKENTFALKEHNYRFIGSLVALAVLH